jgi:ribose transport system permease protein
MKKIVSILDQALHDRVYSLFITIIVLSVISALVWPALFPTFGNISQVLLNLSIDAIVSVGMMLLMIGGAFDLSVGSVVAFCGGLTAYLMSYHGISFVPAIVIGLAAALLIGWINGILVARAGINPLIQTLAMMGIVRGLALMVSGSGIQDLPHAFTAIGQTKVLGLQMPVWCMLVIVIIFSILLGKTVFFRRYYFIGNNEKAAVLSGIRVKRMTIYAFMLSALLAGIAGILLVSRLGAAMSTSGEGMELRVITAVVLGGASLNGGQGKITGALLGTLFIGLVGNVMIMARVSGYWQQIIMGLILILAVLADVMLQKSIGRRYKYPIKRSIT